MGLARWLPLLVACSSSKPRVGDDATRVPTPRDAPPIAIDAPPSQPDTTATTGDLQIRVEWKDVPIPARASPGKTACKTPRLPLVTPTTTWGIPDVLVVVEGATLPSKESRIVLADCALSPRILATSAPILESAFDRPAKLTFAKRGEVTALDKLEAGTPRPVQLPIAGHAVTLPVEPNGVYELAFDGESAWIIASASAGVTEASGGMLVKDLAPGTYAVTAWLPPRAGGQAKLVKGTAKIVAGDVEDLTLTLP